MSVFFPLHFVICVFIYVDDDRLSLSPSRFGGDLPVLSVSGFACLSKSSVDSCFEPPGGSRVFVQACARPSDILIVLYYLYTNYSFVELD